MDSAVSVALADVGGSYPLYIGGQRFDVGENRYFDERVARVVCLKLVAALDGAQLLRSVNLDSDGANLTRLDDFFEVKVACFASAGRGPRRSHRPDGKHFFAAPHRRS